MSSFSQSLTFFKKRNRLPSSNPNLSITSSMMRRKARRVRSHTEGSLWKLPVPIPVPKAKKCYRCGDPYSKEHMEHCKAKNATCRACNKVGHYAKVL